PVRRRRHEARAVRAERGAEDLARVPPALGEQRAGARFPQANRPVLAARGEARAVRAEGNGPDVALVALADRRSFAGGRVEHRAPYPLAVASETCQPGPVRADDDGDVDPRHVHATEDLAGLVEQFEGRVPDPRHDAQSATCLRGTDRASAFEVDRQGPGLAA